MQIFKQLKLEKAAFQYQVTEFSIENVWDSVNVKDMNAKGMKMIHLFILLKKLSIGIIPLHAKPNHTRFLLNCFLSTDFRM